MSDEEVSANRLEDDSEHMEAGMEQECGGIDPAEKQDTAELTAACGDEDDPGDDSGGEGADEAGSDDDDEAEVEEKPRRKSDKRGGALAKSKRGAKKGATCKDADLLRHADEDADRTHSVRGGEGAHASGL